MIAYDAVADAVATAGPDLFSAAIAGYYEARRAWAANRWHGKLPSRIFTATATELVKHHIREGVRGVSGASTSGRFLLRGHGFRVHRTHLRGRRTLEDYCAEDLLSPQLNRVTAGELPAFVLLWVAEGHAFHLWAVAPAAVLRPDDGGETQFASFPKSAGGLRWSWAIRLQPAPVRQATQFSLFS